MNALNIYQLKINNTLLFMHKVKNNTTPSIFKQSFNINTNKYNTKSTNTKFHKPLIKTKYNQYSIVYRGPHLWNSLISDTLIDLPFSSFKTKIKEMLFHLDENRETSFF